MTLSGNAEELYWTDRTIAALRSAALSQTVNRACRMSDFWRQRFADARLDPQTVTDPLDLLSLPPLAKRDLMQAGRSLWCAASAEIVDVVTTSGTTGQPLVYPLTRGDIDRLGYNEKLSFTCAGLTADDVVVLAVTMDRCFMAGMAYYQGLLQIGATAVRVGAGAPGMLLSVLDRLGPTAVVSVPSFLRVVADYAAERGVSLADCSVAKLICIGEPVRDESLSLTPTAAALESAWGADVYSTYGATEIAGSLCECEARRGGHEHPELLHLEVLDDSGKPVPDGQVGEVVVTTLGVEAMPLIRFRTADVAFRRTDRCRCGRRTARIGPILGRKSRMLKLKGTTVYPAAVQRALEMLADVQDYVLIATDSGPLSDELEVLVHLRRDSGLSEDAIADHLQGELKVTPAVRVVQRESIATLQMGALRKKRVFVDRRTSQR